MAPVNFPYVRKYVRPSVRPSVRPYVCASKAFGLSLARGALTILVATCDVGHWSSDAFKLRLNEQDKLLTIRPIPLTAKV